MRKDTIENMVEVARLKGGKCLSKRYVSQKVHLQWECEKKHTWLAMATNVKRGSWCPECASRALSLEHFQELAKKKGGRCLSKKYSNAKIHLKWECDKKHRWETTASVIQQGFWCPACARLSQRSTIEDMHKMAKKKGGKCLSKAYTNAKSHLKWECEEKHRWETTPDVIQSGSWCPCCSGQKTRIADFQKIAESKGGKCLSEKYQGSHIKLKLECEKGHQWKAAPTSIKSGHWCPYCSGRRKSITKFKELVESKGGKCLSKKYLGSSIKHKVECGKKHRWETAPTTIRYGSWCPTCARLACTLTIEEMQEIAKKRGGKCLSKLYVNGKTKLKWQCGQGHEWKARPLSVKKDNWCPTCAVLSKLSTIEVMHEVAKKKDGKCLSALYTNSSTKLLWRCKRGHEWMAKPSVVKYGDWCPKCAKISRSLIQIKVMQEIAKNKGGKCLSERYTNSNTKLRWQCNKGHQWMAMSSDVRRGTWCSACHWLSIRKGKPEVEFNTITKTLKVKLMNIPKEARSIKRKLEKNNICFK